MELQALGQLLALGLDPKDADARLDRLKIIFADDESIILEGDAAARLVIESPLSPAEVLEDKKSFSHFKL